MWVVGRGGEQLHRDFLFNKQILTTTDYEAKNNVNKFGVAILTTSKKKNRKLNYQRK